MTNKSLNINALLILIDWMKMKNKYLYIQTFGCQMNVHDSEQMAALLADSGYKLTENIKLADLILLNTCSIREKAAHKVLQ